MSELTDRLQARITELKKTQSKLRGRRVVEEMAETIAGYQIALCKIGIWMAENKHLCGDVQNTD